MLQPRCDVQLNTKYSRSCLRRSHPGGGYCQGASIQGNIASTQKIDTDDSNIIPDNTSSVREEPWGHIAHPTHTSSSSAAPQPSTSVLQSGSSSREKSTFIPSCLDKVKELASQENTHSTLLLILKEEAASHIEDTTAQAETDKRKLWRGV